MLKMTGQNVLIHTISPVIEIPSKTGGNPFLKREVVIDDTWQNRDGAPMPSYVAIEFTGDRMALLDTFKPGDRVNIEASVSGREHNGRYFNSLRGMSIVPAQMQYGAPQGIGTRPAPAPGYSLQTPAPQAPAYGQPQQAYGQQTASYGQQAAYAQPPAYGQHPATYPAQGFGAAPAQPANPPR